MDDVRGDVLRPPHGTTPAALWMMYGEINCTMDDVRGDVLRPPHGTTPAISFQSKTVIITNSQIARRKAFNISLYLGTDLVTLCESIYRLTFQYFDPTPRYFADFRWLHCLNLEMGNS